MSKTVMYCVGVAALAGLGLAVIGARPGRPGVEQRAWRHGGAAIGVQTELARGNALLAAGF